MSGSRERGRANSPFDEKILVSEFLDRVRRLGKAAGFLVETYAQVGQFELPVLTRGLHLGDVLYVSSGIHGDEPAGPLGIAAALEAGVFGDAFGWMIFPVLNPTGLQEGRRETLAGVDLNRDYRSRRAEEVRAHCDFLEASPKQFTGALGLHEDWEASGGYLYEHNRELLPNPCRALVSSLEQTIGLESGEEIDGWPTCARGLIHPPSEPEFREVWPEQIYLLNRFTKMSYTVETPSEFPLVRRISAHLEAIRAFGDPASWNPVSL